jgi:hypothetical protein
MMTFRSNGQTRTGAFVEAWANVAIGYGINLAANLAVLPMFGFNVTIVDAAGIGLIFTVISVARSYFVRRIFNRA